MLKKIDNSLSDPEIELAFRKFDLDGDKIITFKQFREIFTRFYHDGIQQIIRAD